MRRVGRTTQARRQHRFAARALVLPALAFRLTGLFHLVQATNTPVPASRRLSPPLATKNIVYPLRAQWAGITRDLDTSSLSLAQEA